MEGCYDVRIFYFWRIDGAVELYSLSPKRSRQKDSHFFLQLVLIIDDRKLQVEISYNGDYDTCFERFMGMLHMHFRSIFYIIQGKNCVLSL